MDEDEINQPNTPDTSDMCEGAEAALSTGRIIDLSLTQHTLNDTTVAEFTLSQHALQDSRASPSIRFEPVGIEDPFKDETNRMYPLEPDISLSESKVSEHPMEELGLDLSTDAVQSATVELSGVEDASVNKNETREISEGFLTLSSHQPLSHSDTKSLLDIGKPKSDTLLEEGSIASQTLSRDTSVGFLTNSTIQSVDNTSRQNLLEIGRPKSSTFLEEGSIASQTLSRDTSGGFLNNSTIQSVDNTSRQNLLEIGRPKSSTLLEEGSIASQTLSRDTSEGFLTNSTIQSVDNTSRQSLYKTGQTECDTLLEEGPLASQTQFRDLSEEWSSISGHQSNNNTRAHSLLDIGRPKFSPLPEESTFSSETQSRIISEGSFTMSIHQTMDSAGEQHQTDPEKPNTVSGSSCSGSGEDTIIRKPHYSDISEGLLTMSHQQPMEDTSGAQSLLHNDQPKSMTNSIISHDPSSNYEKSSSESPSRVKQMINAIEKYSNLSVRESQFPGCGDSRLSFYPPDVHQITVSESYLEKRPISSSTPSSSRHRSQLSLRESASGSSDESSLFLTSNFKPQEEDSTTDHHPREQASGGDGANVRNETKSPPEVILEAGVTEYMMPEEREKLVESTALHDTTMPQEERDALFSDIYTVPPREPSPPKLPSHDSGTLPLSSSSERLATTLNRIEDTHTGERSNLSIEKEEEEFFNQVPSDTAAGDCPRSVIDQATIGSSGAGDTRSLSQSEIAEHSVSRSGASFATTSRSWSDVGHLSKSSRASIDKMNETSRSSLYAHKDRNNEDQRSELSGAMSLDGSTNLKTQSEIIPELSNTQRSQYQGIGQQISRDLDSLLTIGPPKPITVVDRETPSETQSQTHSSPDELDKLVTRAEAFLSTQQTSGRGSPERRPSQDSRPDSSASTHTVKDGQEPRDNTDNRRSDTPLSQMSESSSTSYRDLPEKIHPSLAIQPGKAPRGKAAEAMVDEGILTNRNLIESDARMDPEVRLVLEKYGEVLSADESGTKLRTNESVRRTPAESVAESDDTDLTNRVNRLLQGSEFNRSYLNEDPANSMTLHLTSGSTSRSDTPQPTLSQQATTATVEALKEMMEIEIEKRRLKLRSESQDTLGERVRHLLGDGVSGRAGGGSQTGSSGRSSLSGSVNFDVLQNDLDEIQRGLDVLQNGELSFRQMENVSNGASSRRMSDASEDTVSKVTGSEIGTPRKFSWDYGDLNAEDETGYRFVTSRTDIQTTKEGSPRRKEPEGGSGSSPKLNPHVKHTSPGKEARTSLEGKYTRIAMELEKETSPLCKLHVRQPDVSFTISSPVRRKSTSSLPKSDLHNYRGVHQQALDAEVSQAFNSSRTYSELEQSMSQKVQDLMERDSPQKLAYRYLAEAEDSLRQVRERSSVRQHSSEGDLRNISHNTSANTSVYDPSPVPHSFAAYGNVRSLLATQLNKASNARFDTSIELKSPFKRHLSQASTSSPDIRSTVEETSLNRSLPRVKDYRSSLIDLDMSLSEYTPSAKPVTMQDYISGTHHLSLAERQREREKELAKERELVEKKRESEKELAKEREQAAKKREREREMAREKEKAERQMERGREQDLERDMAERQREHEKAMAREREMAAERQRELEKELALERQVAERQRAREKELIREREIAENQREEEREVAWKREQERERERERELAREREIAERQRELERELGLAKEREKIEVLRAERQKERERELVISKEQEKKASLLVERQKEREREFALANEQERSEKKQLEQDAKRYERARFSDSVADDLYQRNKKQKEEENKGRAASLDPVSDEFSPRNDSTESTDSTMSSGRRFSRTEGQNRSSRSSNANANLRPYRPPGSNDLYYVESGTDDGNVSVANSETTVESTHIGSDDAHAPSFPHHWLGTRLDPQNASSLGIYSKRSQATGSTQTLHPIAENRSFEEIRHEYKDQAEDSIAAQNRSHHNNSGHQQNQTDSSSDHSAADTLYTSQGQEGTATTWATDTMYTSQGQEATTTTWATDTLYTSKGQEGASVSWAPLDTSKDTSTSTTPSHNRSETYGQFHCLNSTRSSNTFGTPQKHGRNRSTENTPQHSELYGTYHSESSYIEVGGGDRRGQEKSPGDDLTGRLRLYHNDGQALDSSANATPHRFTPLRPDLEGDEGDSSHRYKSRDHSPYTPSPHPRARLRSPPPRSAPTPPATIHTPSTYHTRSPSPTRRSIRSSPAPTSQPVIIAGCNVDPSPLPPTTTTRQNVDKKVPNIDSHNDSFTSIPHSGKPSSAHHHHSPAQLSAREREVEQLASKLQPGDQREQGQDLQSLWERFQQRPPDTKSDTRNLDMSTLSRLLKNPVKYLVLDSTQRSQQESVDRSVMSKKSHDRSKQSSYHSERGMDKAKERAVYEDEERRSRQYSTYRDEEGGESRSHLAKSPATNSTTLSNASTDVPYTSSRRGLREETTLQSIPEDSTLSTTDVTSSESNGTISSLQLLPDDPRLLKLQTKILRQRQKYEHEKRREERRKEKIQKLEKLLVRSKSGKSKPREEREVTRVNQHRHQHRSPPRPASSSSGKSTSTPSSARGTGESDISLTVSEITTDTVTPLTLSSDQSSNTLIEMQIDEESSAGEADQMQVSKKSNASICKCCLKKKSRSRDTPKSTDRLTLSSRKPRSKSPNKEKSKSPTKSKSPHRQRTNRSPSPSHKRSSNQVQEASESLKKPKTRHQPRETHKHISTQTRESHKMMEPENSKMRERSKDSRHTKPSASRTSRSSGQSERYETHSEKYEDEEMEILEMGDDILIDEPSKKTIGVNIPTPISLSPPRRREVRDVIMVSEAVQTTPNLSHSPEPRQQRGPYTPSSDSSTLENVQPTQSAPSIKARAGQTGLAWYIPLKESRPWRQPLRERQANAIALSDNWPPKRQAWTDDNHNISTTENQYSFTITDDQPRKISLQDALEHFRSDFISRSRERLKHLSLRSEERRIQELHARQRAELFHVERKLDPNKDAHPYSENLFKPKKRFMTKKEMKDLTNRKYATLEEVKKKKVDEKRLEEYRANRIRAQMYKKKVLNQVLYKKAAWTQ